MWRGLVSAAPFVAVILWQVYLVWLAFRVAPTLELFLGDLGQAYEDMSWVVVSFLRFYRFTVVVPFAFVVLCFDVVRRRPVPRLYLSVVTGVALLAAFALHAWTTEAFLSPMLRLIENIR